MKPLILLLLAGLATGCVADEPVELSPAARSRLDEAVAGRTAGPPLACVPQRELRGNRSLGEDVILFEGPGDTVYVNRPSGGCARLDIGRALVTRTISSQLCRGDIATVVDPVNGIEWGACTLGDFVPYRRTR